jgi:hypothetical protein
MLRSIKCELSSTLVERVEIELHISERTHKLNVIKVLGESVISKSLVWLLNV